MKNYNTFDWLALIVLIIGGVNWGMVGAFNINLVSLLFGEMTILTRLIYSLVGLSAIYITFAAMNLTEPSGSTRVVQSQS